MYNFAKTCEILLKDTPPSGIVFKKYDYPAVNSKRAYSYACSLDQVIDFSDPDKESKAESLLFHKLVSYTMRHMIHRYKRRTLKDNQFKVWNTINYFSGEGSYVSYISYPLIEDLCALRKEIIKTSVVNIIEPEKIEHFLENLNIGALSDIYTYRSDEFYRDFTVVHEYWTGLIDFIKNFNKLT